MLLDQAGAGHHHRQLDVFGHFLTELFDNGSGLAHVFDAAVGAGANEDLVDKNIVEPFARLQAHVGQRTLDGVAFVGVFFLVRVRHDAVDAEHHLGRGAPGDLRDDLRCVELYHAVKLGTCVGLQRLPICNRLVPLRAADKLAAYRVGARRQQAAFEVLDGFLVHRHQARPCTGFNRHVAHRHPAFHRQRADGRAGKFDGVARAARRADFADHGQHDVFAGATFGQNTFDFDQQVFGLLGQQRLGRHHVLDLARADAVGQRAKRAVGRGV